MVVPRGYVLRAAGKLIDEERHEIFKTLSRTDERSSRSGRMNSPSWRSERHRVIVAGVIVAGNRIMAEVRVHAGAKAPSFAEDVGALVARLSDSLVEGNREILMLGGTDVPIIEVEQSCQKLADALQEVCERVVENLKHGSTRDVSSSQSLAGGNINIHAGELVSLGDGDFSQNAPEDFDAAGLVALLSQLRSVLEASRTAAGRQLMLRNQIRAIQILAQSPQPDRALLARSGSRLLLEVKAANLPVTVRAMLAELKQRLGLP